MGGARMLALIGILAWAVSWFVSPHKAITLLKAGSDTADTLAGLGGGSHSKDSDVPSGPPGWIAFRAAWDMAFSGKTEHEEPGPYGMPDVPTISEKHDKSDVAERSLGYTCLTNFLMVLAVLAFFGGARGGGAILLGVLLLASAAFDGGWFYRNNAEFREGLEAGYWLWVGSFLLVGLGFIFGRNRAPAS